MITCNPDGTYSSAAAVANNFTSGSGGIFNQILCFGFGLNGRRAIEEGTGVGGRIYTVSLSKIFILKGKFRLSLSVPASRQNQLGDDRLPYLVANFLKDLYDFLKKDRQKSVSSEEIVA